MTTILLGSATVAWLRFAASADAAGADAAVSGSAASAGDTAGVCVRGGDTEGARVPVGVGFPPRGLRMEAGGSQPPSS